MTKLPIDYAKCKIYRLVCKDINVQNCYIGHTTSFVKRKNKHKENCSNENCKAYNFKVYSTIRANGGWNNWSMILVEDYPCNDVYQASKRERHWCEEYGADLNTNVPSRTKAEWMREHRHTYRDYALTQITCACGCQVTRGAISKHRRTVKHQKIMSALNIQDAETDSTL